MVDLHKWKPNAFLKAIETLSIRISYIEGIVAKFNNNHMIVTYQPVLGTISHKLPSKDSMMFQSQEKNSLP